MFNFFYKRTVHKLFKYFPFPDYSILQFIAFPFLFLSYKKYLHYHNNNIHYIVSHNNKKILSKNEYVDRYKIKVEELYKKYRSSISKHLSHPQLECTDFAHLNHAYIIEYTPKGNVIMTYNHNDNTTGNDITIIIMIRFP